MAVGKMRSRRKSWSKIVFLLMLFFCWEYGEAIKVPHTGVDGLPSKSPTNPRGKRLPKLRLSKQTISTLGGKAWNTAASAADDFAAGVKQVHNNYLSLVKTQYGRQFRYACPMFLTFAALNWSLGDTWTHGIRVLLLKSIIFGRWVCCLPLATIVRPLYRRPIFAGPPSFAARLQKEGTLRQRRPLTRKVISDMAVVSVISEVVYRAGSFALWKSIFGRSGSRSASDNEEDEVEGKELSITSQQRWVKFCSFVYAWAVATSSVPGVSKEWMEKFNEEVELMNEENSPDIVAAILDISSFFIYHVPISEFMFNSLGMFVVSSRVLSPVYIERGVMASIGASFVWTLSERFVFPQILVRLLFRVLRP